MSQASQGQLVFGWILPYDGFVPNDRFRALRQRVRSIGAGWDAWSHGALEGSDAIIVLVGVLIAAAEPDPLSEEAEDAEEEDVFSVLCTTRITDGAVRAAQEQVRADGDALVATLAPIDVRGDEPRLFLNLTGGARRTLLRDAEGSISRCYPDGAPTDVTLPPGDHQMVVL